MVKQRVEAEISGGIGNQLFQFAAALTLSKRLDAELILDVSWYRRNSRLSNNRQLELKEFVDLGTLRQISNKRHPKVELAVQILQNYKLISDANTDPLKFRSLSSSRHIRLRGYWQNEQYFAPISADLRSMFSQHLIMSRFANEIAKQIKVGSSLGLHVRRGDYVTNPKTNLFHGVCDASYFERAVNVVCNSVDVDQVYIFSDDVSGCRDNLHFNIRTVLVETSVIDTEQLKLLSICKHHVISNSSFSWWAAWFGHSDEQVVIYPEAWFSDKSSLKNMPVHWKPL